MSETPRDRAQRERERQRRYRATPQWRARNAENQRRHREKLRAEEEVTDDATPAIHQ